MKYPETARGTHVDTYHGVTVADPYRWLEDDNSAETAAWVRAQNEVTAAHLAGMPFRAQLAARLEQLYNYPKYSAPIRRGRWYFFARNDGLQNQAVWYRQLGLDGVPELLLDPNTFSADATTKLSIFALSPDGARLAYGLSVGGSDWQELRVLDVTTGQTLDDRVQWVKVSGAAWSGQGFFYSRYPETASGRDLSTKNVDHRVYFHRVGTPQSDDELVFADPLHPERFHTVEVTEDERFAILTVSDRGTGAKGNALFYRDLRTTDTTFLPIIAVVTDDSYGVVDVVGERFLIQTNHDAPHGRVVVFDPAKPEDLAWSDLIPERAEPLESVESAAGRLFAVHLKDVTSQVSVFTRDGQLEHALDLPGPGTAGGFQGRHDDEQVFYTFTSFNYPPTIFTYDVAGARSSVYRAVDIPGFVADDYDVTQVFVPSRDGTRVPMFLTHRKGIVLDGTNPTLMYAYGGFNITTGPAFNPLRIALLERGFIHASVNTRGGGEYGESWHEAGTKTKKQNVFDDFIAAAEWLIAHGYTSAAKLAMTGGSNGGLLVGAVMNQRPDLFAVAVPQVGVMDMLRFHTFTIGWNWVPDYGSVANADEFNALYAYSPLHNLRAGTRYPATLVVTADHDDRVVPAHSFKYAAALQASQSGDAPVLIRIDTNSGHGASNTSKQLETATDIYAFLIWHLRAQGDPAT